MVVSSKVDLVDGAILFTPIREFDEAILFRYVRNRPNDGVT